MMESLSKVLKAWGGAYPGPDGEPSPMQFIADIVHGLGQWPALFPHFEMLAYEFLSADLIGRPGDYFFNWDFIHWVVAQLRPHIRRKYRLNEAGFYVGDESDDEDYSMAFLAVADQITLGWKDRAKAQKFVDHFIVEEEFGGY